MKKYNINISFLFYAYFYLYKWDNSFDSTHKDLGKPINSNLIFIDFCNMKTSLGKENKYDR